MNVKQNLAILFYLKRKKTTKDGRIPIYIRITIDGREEEISMGLKVFSEDWDGDTKTVRSTDVNCKAINKKISLAETDIERHFYLMQAKHGLATTQLVKASYLTPVNGHTERNHRVENLKLSETLNSVITAFFAYNEKVIKSTQDGRQPSFERQELLNEEKLEIKKSIEKLVKQASLLFDDKNRQKTLMLAVDEYLFNFLQLAFTGHRSPNTLEKWIGRKRRYLDFLQYKFKKPDILLSELEFKFLNNLVNYLLVQHEVGVNTAMKYAQCIKEIMDTAVSNGWVQANIFSTFQCKYVEPQHGWPTMQEMEELMNLEFDKESLNEVRDIAVATAFTGFSYQEIYAARPTDIYIGFDGKKWLGRTRQKTGEEEAVPLLPIVLRIIKKYANHPLCIRRGTLLPVPTNVHYNRCLKEINKRINSKFLDRTHRLRFFFANEVTFNQGVPLKTVSKMLGHKSIKTTEVYVRANKHNISENMQMVETKLFTRDGELKNKEKEVSQHDISRHTACGLKVVHIRGK